MVLVSSLTLFAVFLCVRVSAQKIIPTYDNSVAGQPMLNGVQASPRYITWAEGTTDEMCLSILTSAPKK